MLIMCITKSIKIRYQTLNAKLMTITTSSRMIRGLQQFVRIYRILGETIEIFNNLFGYKILLIIFLIGMQLVYSLNFPLGSLNTVRFSIHLIICNIIYLTMILVSYKRSYFKIITQICRFALFGWYF